MIKEFLHVGISVKNLEESIKFYTAIMQMEIDYRSKNKGDTISRIVGVENADIDVCVVKTIDCMFRSFTDRFTIVKTRI